VPGISWVPVESRTPPIAQRSGYGKGDAAAFLGRFGLSATSASEYQSVNSSEEKRAPIDDDQLGELPFPIPDDEDIEEG
jgi:hypothetical protein